ncbi:MAG: SoxR reducing system RseC family protein [bacterium]
MIKTTGIIIEKKNELFKIKIDEASCSSCGNHNECSLAKIPNSRIIEVPLIEGVNVGDKVELDIEQGKVLFLSVLFYLVPSILILLFSLAGYFIFKSEFWAAILGLAGVACGFIVIFIIEKKKKNSFKHKIKRVLYD